MKKLLSLAMALVMVLSMGVMAFATAGNEDPETELKEANPVTIKKEVEIVNQGTLKPDETFSFTVGKGSVLSGNAESAPDFDPDKFDIKVLAAALSGDTTIDLPDFEHVGEYLYPITEDDVSTAGFVKDDATYYLKITVINNDAGDGFIRVLTLHDEKNVKTDAFENKFKAGSLVINKEITGNYAVFTDEFEVTVVLTPDEGKNIKEGPITVTGAFGETGNVVKNEDGTVTVTFTVTHDSTVTIANVPYDVSYEVTEDAGDYTATITGDNGKIEEALQEVEIVNNLDQEVATGVNLDNLPYILILGAVTIGLFGFTMKRRFNNR